ncbi:PepSY domain-containing protein [Vagococcus entomophilus]|nr:PepSY domain-containing protein [Vagococcus entomophilus]
MKKISILGIVGLSLFLGACTQAKKDEAKQNNQLTSLTSIQQSEGGTSATKETNSISQETTRLTLAHAVQIYESNYPNTSVTSIELDSSFGIYYYEIKGVDDQKEYELKIHAKTGDIKKKRVENLENDEKNGVERKEKGMVTTNLLSLEEITSRAQEAAGDGTAVEWNLEKELDTVYWEVKVKSGKSETDVTLNAETGTVLEVEKED